MTEGTAILLLVIAELGLVITIAGIVGAILWTRRRRREQQAMAELITTVTGRQDARRVTLTGWLSHYLGYPEQETVLRADQLLEAETGIYRRMIAAIQESDAERLEGIVAGMDILTHLYREAAAAAPGDAGDNIAYTTAPVEADDELTKLGEYPSLDEDLKPENDRGPEDREEEPVAPDGGADPAAPHHDEDPLFGDEGTVPAKAGGIVNMPADVPLRPAGIGPQGVEALGETPAEPETGPPRDTMDQTNPDPAWEEALREQAAGTKGDEAAPAGRRHPESDPLGDLFDDGEDTDGEPPVHR